MRRVIIESPYAGNIEQNTIYARRAMAHSLSEGEAPLASHLLYTQPGILNEDIPEERVQGILAGLAWMRHAEVVAVYADYGISAGVENAIAHAKQLGIPVEYRTIGDNP